MIFTHTHVFTRIMDSTSLTYNYVTCLSELTSEEFNTKTFAF